jgi:hypothetical protein
LPAVRRLSKPAILLVAVAGLALALSACAFFKEGSLSVSQPGGIGPARVHFVLCTQPEKEKCEPNEGEGQAQYLLGVAVPPGSSAPATITAAASAGGSPIVFSRNDQVAPELSASIAADSEIFKEAWPPVGLEGIGYLSGVVNEVKESTIEWTVDADFGLPTASAGGPFAGPFKTSPALGFRVVNAENPPDRPVRCFRFSSEESANESEAFCAPSGEEAEVATSDLRIGAAPTARVFVGGHVPLPFSFNFASTAPALPTFNVVAGSTLVGAALTVSSPSFTPAAPAPENHLSPPGSETVTVTVPKAAKPGVYDVTITASTPQGGTATQVAKLEVTKPKLKVKVKPNRTKGTAKLSVGVPSAGTLTVSGKGIVKVQRKSTGPKTLKVTIKAKGKAKAKLGKTGKAKVKAKIVFKPTNGAAVTKTKSIALKKKLAG